MGNSNKYATFVGSYMVALFLKSGTHPKVGETVICNTFHQSSGGKGSNQCIAAARLGINTKFVACIGDDQYGKDALEIYTNEGIDTSGIRISKDYPTGLGVILINEKGENIISVELGANNDLSFEDINSAIDIFKHSTLVGFQLENPKDVVEYGIRKCQEIGVDVLLDPAPAQELTSEIYPFISYITPNETEAEFLTGIKVHDKKSAFEASRWFIERGVKHVLVTLGDKGVVYNGLNGERFYKSTDDVAIDTTGAGDSFSGAFVAGLTKGKSLEESIQFAIKASGLSVTKLGVLESLPYLEEVE